jgi:hypothetical protein
MGIGNNTLMSSTETKITVEEILAIANNAESSVLLQVANEIFGGETLRLLREEAFFLSHHLTEIRVDDGEGDCLYPLERRDGHNGYFSPTDGWVTVSDAQVAVYRVNFTWLLNQIAMGLGITGGPSPRVILKDSIWALGGHRIEGEQIQIIVVRRLAEAVVYEALRDHLTTHHGPSSPALVIALDSHISAHLTLPAQNQLIRIAQAVVWERDLFELNRRTLALRMGSTPVSDGFSVDYRTARSNGVDYEFTPMQAEVLEVLHKSGNKMHQAAILASTGSTQERLIYIFRPGKKMHPAWGTILKSEGKGFYRIDI